MTNPSTRLAELLGELRQILEDERSILLSGNPARITVVVERKLLIAEMIERECKMPGVAAPSVETILWLDRYNRGNSVICSAMLRHLTQTLDKLRQRESHRSYGPNGMETSPQEQNPLGAA
jgi:flagellar biosynthesis/type III secretory pathway chaperone